MSNCFNYMILIIPVLINIAFITLLERKILGYTQLRKGPNKVSMVGLAQPFNDAIKLFSKEVMVMPSSNVSQYLLSPAVALIIVMVTFILFPMKEYMVSMGASVMLMYTMLSMNVYPLLVSGWSSNSKYALIGAMRGIAQTVSYEVSLATILIFYLGLSLSFSLEEMASMNNVWTKVLIFSPLMGMWLVSSLAETNRTPFDFSEGESELVSGFNVEYGGLGFALIFMAEYGSIMFLSIVFVSLFLSASSSSAAYWMAVTTMIFIWVWARTTFPRYRYDKLMNLAWKTYLPTCLLVLGYMLIIMF